MAYDDASNKITTLTNEESAEHNIYDFSQIFNLYMSYVGFLAPITIVPSANEFKSSYSALIKSLLQFLDNYVTNVNNSVAPNSLELVFNIVYLIWGLTDKIELMSMFVEMECVEKALRWVSTATFTSNIKSLGQPIFNIIHNLSRNQKGRIRLRRLNAFKIVIDCKEIVDQNRDNKELTEDFDMTLIALATDDEQSEENKKKFCDAGESMYDGCKEALEAVNFRNDNGLHLSETLELLHRAFSITYVIKHILDSKSDENPTPIQYFAKLLISFYGVLLDPERDELEKRVGEYLLKILLQISSYPAYIEKLIDDNVLCAVIECLTKRSKQNDAKKIWRNMQKILSPDKPEKLTSPDIYVSYDRADEEFCEEFLKVLREEISIPIWADYENMALGDDIWKQASARIDSAMIIIVFVSTTYAENTAKFQELSYIVSVHNKSKKREKSLIVVQAESDFTFNGCWMSDLLGAKTRISYREDNIHEMASEVVKEITVSNKSPIKCFPFRSRIAQRSRVKKDHSPDDSQMELLKSVSIADSNVPPPRTFMRNKLTDSIDDSKTLSSTAKHDSYSIVTRLAPQTGSADPSNWV